MGHGSNDVATGRLESSGGMDRDEEAGSLKLGRRNTAVSISRILFLHCCPQTTAMREAFIRSHLCTLILVHSARELTVSSLFGALTLPLEYHRQCLYTLNWIVLRTVRKSTLVITET